MKTATGIERFQEERGFGKWFNMLFAVVKTRDSCQPEQALGPSSLQKTNIDDIDKSEKGELFIPVKKRQKVRANEKLDAAAIEVMDVVKESLKNDHTKDLIAFMKEEMDKSCEHELNLAQLMCSSRQNYVPNYQIQQQQPSHQVTPPCSTVSNGEGTSMFAGYYPGWHGAVYGRDQQNSSNMFDQSSDVSQRTRLPSVSNENRCGGKTFKSL